MKAETARRLLHRERVRLEALATVLRVPSTAELSAELAPFADQHPADVGSEVFERDKEMSILASIEAELAEVDDAEARLERGTFGTCVTCGSAIPDERLEVVPATRYCAEHAAGVPAGPSGDGSILELWDRLPLAVRQSFAERVVDPGVREHLGLPPVEDGTDEGESGPEDLALHVETT